MRSETTQVFKLSSVFRNGHTPLLQLHKLDHLAVPLIRRKVLGQKFSFETSP
ncbi:hypothetical protein A2U01_0114986, partial [Trifolium medium]|nr:hypothetical protein [Trifolium medium]